MLLPISSALAADQPRPALTLLLFWRSDCAPCVRELDIIPSIAKAHPELHIELLSLDPHPGYAPMALADNVHWVFMPKSPEQTLENFGNTRHALPYSVFVSGDRSLCGSHYGILGTQTVDRWIAQC